MGSQAGIAGALGIAQPDEAKPRLTLEPAQCAVGISRSGAGFRVIHTLSGKELGIVARVGDGWCFATPSAERLTDAMFHYSTPSAAATALSAHVLDHKLSAIRDRLALAADTATPPWPPVQLSEAMAALAKAEAENAQKDAAEAAERRARAAGGEVA